MEKKAPQTPKNNNTGASTTTSASGNMMFDVDHNAEKTIKALEQQLKQVS